MKKFLLLIIAAVLLTASAYAYDEKISVYKTVVTVPASGTMYSPALDLSGKHGFFSEQVVVTGSGTLTIAYQLSNSEKAPYTWSTPVDATAIVSGLTAGTYMYKFEPYTIGLWLRLSFTETGTSSTVTVDSKMVSQ